MHAVETGEELVQDVSPEIRQLTTATPEQVHVLDEDDAWRQGTCSLEKGRDVGSLLHGFARAPDSSHVLHFLRNGAENRRFGHSGRGYENYVPTRNHSERRQFVHVRDDADGVVANLLYDYGLQDDLVPPGVANLGETEGPAKERQTLTIVDVVLLDAHVEIEQEFLRLRLSGRRSHDQNIARHRLISEIQVDDEFRPGPVRHEERSIDRQSDHGIRSDLNRLLLNPVLVGSFDRVLPFVLVDERDDFVIPAFEQLRERPCVLGLGEHRVGTIQRHGLVDFAPEPHLLNVDFGIGRGGVSRNPRIEFLNLFEITIKKVIDHAGNVRRDGVLLRRKGLQICGNLLQGGTHARDGPKEVYAGCKRKHVDSLLVARMLPIRTQPGRLEVLVVRQGSVGRRTEGTSRRVGPRLEKRLRKRIQVRIRTSSKASGQRADPDVARV